MPPRKAADQTEANRISQSATSAFQPFERFFESAERSGGGTAYYDLRHSFHLSTFMSYKFRRLLYLLIGDFSWTPPAWAGRFGRRSVGWVRSHRWASIAILAALIAA